MIAGFGVGMNVGIVSAQVRHSSEIDLFYNQEIRRVNNLQLGSLDTGVSWNEDILNKRRYDNYSLLGFSKNYNNDLIWTFNREAYVILGGGISVTLNLSEVMRRARSLFKGGCIYD